MLLPHESLQVAVLREEPEPLLEVLLTQTLRRRRANEVVEENALAQDLDVRRLVADLLQRGRAVREEEVVGNASLLAEGSARLIALEMLVPLYALEVLGNEGTVEDAGSRRLETLLHGAAALQLLHHQRCEALQVARVQTKERGGEKLADVAVRLQDENDQIEVVHATRVHDVELVPQFRRNDLLDRRRDCTIRRGDLRTNRGNERVGEEDLHTAVAHGSRNLAEGGVHHKEDAEVVVRVNDTLLAVHQTALVDEQTAVVLQQTVQTVQHRCAAEVGVVEHHPVPAHDGLDERAVNPLEAHVA